MFVAFEGIDGSGKTTVSNRVVDKLRQRGLKVEHVREGGEFSSPLVSRLREIGKDRRNVALLPVPEMLLYLAREAQVTEELTVPALAKADIVIADRYFYSYKLLGSIARGVDRKRLDSIIDQVANGLWPDAVVLMDVDPRVGRARRKSSKIKVKAHGDAEGGGSRKSLGGVGVQQLLRDGYRAMAQADPKRWVIIDNSSPDVELDKVVDRVCEAILAVKAGKPAAPKEAGDGAMAVGAASVTNKNKEEPLSLESAPHRFFRAVELRSEREPATAAYFLAGLGHPEAGLWRERLAERAPHVVAYGLRGLGDEHSWTMREELAATSPYHVARSLDGLAVEGERAEAMRVSLVDREPAGVLATLDGNDSPKAWVLRDRLVERFTAEVVGSLKRIDSAQAWNLREHWVRQLGGADALLRVEVATVLAGSVRGLTGDRAWQVRHDCFEAAPVAVLESLLDVDDEQSWEMRQAWVERAPKIVLRTLVRQDDPRGWAMREQLAARCKEALDAMVGDDSAPAWKLREAYLERWTSTAVKSLGPLYHTERGRALAERGYAMAPDDLSLLKHIASLSQLATTAAASDVSVEDL